MDKSHQGTCLVSVITYFIMNPRLDQEEEQASSVSSPNVANKCTALPQEQPLSLRALLQSPVFLVQPLAHSISIPPGSTSQILSTGSLLAEGQK